MCLRILLSAHRRGWGNAASDENLLIFVESMRSRKPLTQDDVWDAASGWCRWLTGQNTQSSDLWERLIHALWMRWDAYRDAYNSSKHAHIDPRDADSGPVLSIGESSDDLVAVVSGPAIVWLSANASTLEVWSHSISICYETTELTVDAACLVIDLLWPIVDSGERQTVSLEALEECVNKLGVPPQSLTWHGTLECPEDSDHAST